MIPDKLCPFPFVHLNYKLDETATACYRCLTPLGNAATQSPQEIWNSPEFRAFRLAHLRGEKPEGCRSCWMAEETGARSARDTARASRHFMRHFPAALAAVNHETGEMPLPPRTFEVRFSTACNLRCAVCSPKYSSQWATAKRKHPHLVPDLLNISDAEGVNNLGGKFLDECGDLAKEADYILITGGEPLMHAEHYRFLERILPRAAEITLHYNTNLHYLGLGDRTVVDLWRRFKWVSLLVSVDGTPDIYPYVRSFGDITTVEQNIRRLHADALPNLWVGATCTTSLLNATRLDSIIDYFTHHLECWFHTSLVQWPQTLNAQMIPFSLRQEAVERIRAKLTEVNQPSYRWPDRLQANPHMNPLEQVNTFARSIVAHLVGSPYDGNVVPERTVRHLNALDRLNETNFRATYPEFAPYWPM